MFKWLKKKLRDWLIEPEEKKDDPFLDCILQIDGKAIRWTLHITSSAGLCLVGNPVGKESLILVTSRQAIDSDKFWRLWKNLSGNPKIEWEETPHDKIKR